MWTRIAALIPIVAQRSLERNEKKHQKAKRETKRCRGSEKRLLPRTSAIWRSALKYLAFSTKAKPRLTNGLRIAG